MSNYTTKAQELATLEKIEQLVNELGEDSCLARTFDGIFMQARHNIQYGWEYYFSTYREKLDYYYNKAADVTSKMYEYRRQAEDYRRKYENAKRTIIMLCDKIEEVL